MFFEFVRTFFLYFLYSFSSYLNGIMNSEIRSFCHFSFKFSSQLNGLKKDTVKYGKNTANKVTNEINLLGILLIQ